MEIVHSRPPNFDQIVKVFPLAVGEGVIFAYGDRIYVPSGNKLPPELYAHELVHCNRQLGIGTENWWGQYLEDEEFRYQEELLSHRKELEVLCIGASRQVRRSALNVIAKKLSAQLYQYGPTVTLARAKRDLAACD